MTPAPFGAGGAGDWAALFGQFLLMSLLSIGGAIGTVPELHRFLVLDHHWLNEAQFAASVAIAQSSPGPNLLFVAVMGWTLGGLAGTVVSMAGMLIPSTTLTFAVARWGARHRDTRGVRAFVNGLAPLTVGLVLTAGWVLTAPVRHAPALMAVAAATAVVTWRTRLSPLWLIAAGAAIGVWLGA